MKIGVIVDGDQEQYTLREIFDKIVLPNKVQLLAPIYADMQPKSTALQIVKKASNAISILQTRNVDQIIVLLDREDRPECPGDWAKSLCSAFSAKIPTIDIQVVIKNKKLENWLVADKEAFKKLPSRFDIKNKHSKLIKEVSPDKADNHQDAWKLIINTCKGRKHPGKSKLGREIAANSDPLNISANSRSFRRFLRVIGHEKYKNQSKKPA